ncbi:KAP family P-loop domain-containing protein [Maribacter sedimenticola]|uniref:KAP family P-loop domain-containing protein n=1 Tax=Maribacter sedimenticola TaxID=228956 RepID=A0ABY1SJF5_9FLAO|nr:P-loop NTPase fold protein [Maribacter sedimenticola]SNR64227.1 KAP family P-loop domain-containing protein [Maribacter sedimenticola]
MVIRHEELYIPQGKDSKPFLNCKLGRDKYAKILTSIVGTYNDGFVLAINNRWGSGKTTFVKMWQQQLMNENFTTLYFNAWENDFQEDVIIALLAELKEIVGKGEELFKTVLSKALPLIKQAVPEIIKHTVEKRLGESTADLLNGIGKYSVKELEDSLKEYNNKKKGITEFRNILEQYVATIDSNKPVIFIIDELDRCRPNYSVEVLEQIKHLFSVKGIVFVLSIDKEQLENAVKGFYGSESINSEEYLRRFIDVEYSIPEPDKNAFCDYLFKYFGFSHFFNLPVRKNNNDFKGEEDTFKAISKIIFSNNHVILRQIEKIYGHTAIVLNTFEQHENIFPVSLLFLIHCKINHIVFYQNLSRGSLSLQQLVVKIEEIIPLGSSRSGNRYQSYLMSNMLCLYDNFLKTNKDTLGILSYMEDTGEPKLNVSLNKYQSLNKNIILSVQAFFQKFKYNHESIDKLINKINLSDSFVIN